MLCIIVGLFHNKQGRLLGHFIGKEPLHRKQLGYFTGKRYLIGNGIQTYKPLHRKM